MYPKTLYELLILIDTKKQYSEIASLSLDEDIKRRYILLRNKISELIFKIMEVLNITIEDLNQFYKEMMDYLKERKAENPECSTIASYFQNFDELPYNDSKRKTYHTIVNLDPLFKKIMGREALKQKVQIETTIGMSLNLAETNYDIYGLTEAKNNWKNAIDSLQKEGKITEEQKAYYDMYIDYLADFYWSIINQEQEKYDDTLNSEIGQKR